MLKCQLFVILSITQNNWKIRFFNAWEILKFCL